MSSQEVTPQSRHFTASAVVIHDGRVLLIHHKATGLWMFPGGHVDPDEAPHEAAIREVREETGLIVSVWSPRGELPYPLVIEEFPAPAKPERPGKPAEPAHSHIDFLYPVNLEDGYLVHEPSEVSAAQWFSSVEILNLNSRKEARADVAKRLGELFFFDEL